ncbi:DNA mismatch repair protein [Clostridiaceae bacterium M8S5]|nr:DNA mismatch repair protein [Clostridiaceae bacterium M8S5]
MKKPLDTYEKRKNFYFNLMNKQRKTINKLSNIRLVTVLTLIVNIVILYVTKRYSLIYYVSPAYIALFTILVVKHNKVKRKNKYSNALYKINSDALKRLTGKWNKFKDTGLEFQDDRHSFTSDLDIFGQGSLFQYINTTTTYMGRRTLTKYLSQPYSNKELINKRQEATNELGVKLWWRQRFMVEGLITFDESKNNEELYKFAETNNEIYTKPWLIIGARLLPVISIGCILLCLFRIIPYQIPVIALIIQLLILKFKNKERSKILNLVYKHKDSLKLYSKMLYHIERKHFKSEYLKELKDKLINDDKHTAYQQIKKLEKITDSISNRSNFYFIVINIIALWDYQCMIALERWKKKSGVLTKTWMETIGEFEALSSLADLRYNNPDWVFPNIIDKPYYMKARDIGHPLLTGNRVCNDLEIDDKTKVLLITGSNMSGKSTYLRTAGINLVLAYAGAPVCAKDFSCSIFSICTCMRVKDDLEKNISSFYAELLRIKKIVDASEQKKIFFLLDEVFKGTNSYDRHEGAKILIKKLMSNKAIGLVSTHDLELEVLEKESNKTIRNYHFEEYYKDNKIYFDYKLKSGISTTRNALYLIKMIGID